MKTLTLKFDLKTTLIIALLVVIGVMTFIWQPWSATKSTRTISVTGQAEVTATPDEFLFTPYYERKGEDTAKLKTDIDTLGNKILDEVTKLGVKKEDVTLTNSSYGQTATEPVAPGGKAAGTQPTVTLSVTIKAATKELAQKVQNYLGTTDAKGQLSSQAIFSKTKRKELEAQARSKATDDAKTKADAMAKSLGTSIGRVKEIKDSAQGGVIYPMAAGGAAEDSKSSLPVTPGSDAVSINLEIVFELK